MTHVLDEDLILDILARLPVKSVKRFQVLNKFCCFFIQTPKFISSHYSFSEKKRCPLIKYINYNKPFIPAKRPEEITRVSLICNQTGDVSLDVDVSLHVDLPLMNVEIYCCRGILCLSDLAGGISLWNLATKEVKIVPTYPVEFLPGPEYYNRFDAVGLGYDSKRDDFAVVRIDKFWEWGNPSAGRGTRVALYNLASDSWRKLDANFPAEISVQQSWGRQVFCNGFFHCYAAVNDEAVMVSFDLSNEVFVITAFPDEFFGTRNHSFIDGILFLEGTRFMEINGSLGGLCCLDCQRASHKSYIVWVLGEVGVQTSWTKLFTIGPISDVVDPIGAGSDGDFFFYGAPTTFTPAVEWFAVWHHADADASNQETKRLQVRGTKMQQVMYAESLVSVRGGTAMFNH